MPSGDEMAVEEVQNTNSGGRRNDNSKDKLSYEIFSILESKFLFGYTDPTKLLYLPIDPPPPPRPALPLSLQRGRVCILSIDGNPSIHGGTMASKALSYLEQALRIKSANQEARISDYFDLVAGTGIGGVLSTMLFASDNGSLPLFTADDTWRFMIGRCPQLLARKSRKRGFLRSRKRPLHAATKALETGMKELFGEKLTLKDTLKPILIPCYDLNTCAPFVFSRADAIESNSYDFKLWEVGRATWAEAGRVEPSETCSIDGKTVCYGADGGLVMSNPTCVAITHVLHNKHEFPFVRGVEDVMVVSLGCGPGSDVVKGADWRRWSHKEWARPMARIAAEGSADFVDHAVAMAFGQERSSNYIRIQAYGGGGASKGKYGSDEGYTGLDPTDPQALEAAAEEMLRQKNVESVLFTGKRVGDRSNMEILDRVASELVQEHETRHCRIAPTVIIKQLKPPDPA